MAVAKYVLYADDGPPLPDGARHFIAGPPDKADVKWKIKISDPAEAEMAMDALLAGAAGGVMIALASASFEP